MRDKHKSGEQWIDRARERMRRRGTEGAFSRAAQRAGMDTCAYANHVLRDPKASPKLKRRALFAKNTGCRKRAKRP
jgi:hypothetical protein